MSQPRPPRRRSEDGGKEPSIRRAARKAVDRASEPAGDRRSAAARQRSRAAGAERAKASPARRSRGTRSVPTDLRTELAKAAGAANVERIATILMKAADTLDRGRERDAVRMLKPLRDQVPGSGAIRELLGVALYRIGRYDEARRELDAFVDLTGLVDQHPVLMDCLRGLKRYRRIEKLWDELREVSPSAELVIEGRIVMAGSLTDRGNLVAAIQLLERGPLEPKKVRPHHLRLWYALADTYERSGNIPRARSMFERIRHHDPQFVDVASRLAGLA